MTTRHIDETQLNMGEVVETITKPGERQAWRIVAGLIVGEYSLQYQFSGTSSKVAGAIIETDGSTWRNYVGNDDMSHVRYYTGIRNARAACKRGYDRNN